MKAGDTITQDDIWSKRPGTGIPAKLMPSYIGRKVTVDIPANTMLTEGMLQ
jgi:N-acetylneuraminate synthase